jgi:hypothetical protein
MAQLESSRLLGIMEPASSGNLVFVNCLLVEGGHEIEKQTVKNGNCEQADRNHSGCIFVESKMPHSCMSCPSISMGSRQE